MKVILLQDVKGSGKKGDIINSSDGYARNFILKTKKGIEANAKNMNDLKLKKQNDDKVALEQLEAAKELAKSDKAVQDEKEKIFSFSLSPDSLNMLCDITERYLKKVTMRNYTTLDFYKSMTDI